VTRITYPNTSLQQGLVWQAAFTLALWAAMALVMTGRTALMSRPSLQRPPGAMLSPSSYQDKSAQRVGQFAAPSSPSLRGSSDLKLADRLLCDRQARAANFSCGSNYDT
jgi:hypothetical protein